MEFDTMLRYSKEFSLLWFFLIFIGIVAWAYWPSHKKQFEDEGKKLLEDDPVHKQSAKPAQKTISSTTEE
jgi:cytochrome c oxidase cbb3-type subunit IV